MRLEETRKRMTELEALLRESLTKTGDRAWHEKVHAALREPMPPLRILKGKVPRYQVSIETPKAKRGT